MLLLNRNYLFKFMSKRYGEIKFKSVKGTEQIPYDEPQPLEHYYKYTYDLDIPLDTFGRAGKLAEYPNKYY